jgi:hypothetical protein
MINSFILLALLTVVDPVTGPVGAGDLTPPTAAVYRNLSVFDLQEVTVLDGSTVQLEVKLGSFGNPYGLPLGFSHPVIDIYLGGGTHGTAELLPGHGMRLPEGELWSVAFRLTGDSARGYQVLADGMVQEFTPAVELAADRLSVRTDIPVIASPRVAALVGLYDPFQETGWRPLTAQPNAWAFSSREQAFPVLDVLAIDEAAQATSLLSGILPVTEASSVAESKTLWLLLMASGIAIAGGGLLLRSRAGRPEAVLLPEADFTITSKDELIPAVPAPAENVPGGEATEEAEAVQEIRILPARGASQEEIDAARARLAAEAAEQQPDSPAPPEKTQDSMDSVRDSAEPAEAGRQDPEPAPVDRQAFVIDWDQDSWLDGEDVEFPAVSDPDAAQDEDAG